MKKQLKYKFGIVLFVFVAVCAKIVKARWYDVQSKLTFTTSDSFHDDAIS